MAEGFLMQIHEMTLATACLIASELLASYWQADIKSQANKRL
jgi:hypothetical protein